MSIDIQYTHNGSGVIFTGTGNVTAEDILWVHRKIYKTDENIRKIKFFLNDFTNVRLCGSMTEELFISALQDDEAAMVNPDIIVAIVSSNELHSRIAAVWQEILNYTPWETFSTQSLTEATTIIRQYSGLDINNDYAKRA